MPINWQLQKERLEAAKEPLIELLARFQAAHPLCTCVMYPNYRPPQFVLTAFFSGQGSAVSAFECGNPTPVERAAITPHEPTMRAFGEALGAFATQYDLIVKCRSYTVSEFHYTIWPRVHE